MLHLDPENVREIGKAVGGFLLIGLGNILWNLLTPERSWRSLRIWLAKSWKAKRAAYLQELLDIHNHKTEHPYKALAMALLVGVFTLVMGIMFLGLRLTADLGHYPEGTLKVFNSLSGMAAGGTVGAMWILTTSVAQIVAPQHYSRKLEAKLQRLGEEGTPEA